MPHHRSRRLAFFVPTLHCGGAERMMLNLVRAADEHGFLVDLLVADAQGVLRSQVPPGARLIDFGVRKFRWVVPKLASYLRSQQPYALFSRMVHANLAALIAARLARSSTKLAIIEAIHLSALIGAGQLRKRSQRLVRWLYPGADLIVGVSAGVSHDLEQFLALPPGRVQTIYNPVVDVTLLASCREASPHPWLEDGSGPVIVSVGRLEPQKNHALLLQAMARVRSARPARLIVFGEGQERGRLEALRRELGLEEAVDLPGFCANPFAATARAALYVLSSSYEGLPNALIEALACGCPAVATDCPSGPAEIIDSEQLGYLVPMDAPQAMADAVLAALDKKWDREILRARGAEFSVQTSLTQYLEALKYPLPQVALGSAA